MSAVLLQLVRPHALHNCKVKGGTCPLGPHGSGATGSLAMHSDSIWLPFDWNVGGYALSISWYAPPMLILTHTGQLNTWLQRYDVYLGCPLKTAFVCGKTLSVPKFSYVSSVCRYGSLLLNDGYTYYEKVQDKKWAFYPFYSINGMRYTFYVFWYT